MRRRTRCSIWPSAAACRCSVCARGMQLIQAALRDPATAGRRPREAAAGNLDRRERRPVNSYHRFAAFETRAPLDVWAVADDGAVKAVRHAHKPIAGIMWHPERSFPFTTADIALFRRSFQLT